MTGKGKGGHENREGWAADRKTEKPMYIDKTHQTQSSTTVACEPNTFSFILRPESVIITPWLYTNAKPTYQQHCQHP